MQTYILCKTIIQNKKHKSNEEMLMKLDVFLLNNRISKEEYSELANLLLSQEDEEVTK